MLTLKSNDGMNWEEEKKRMAGLSVDDLYREFADGLTLSARGIKKMALAWNQLKELGAVMPELSGEVAAYLPAVAAGTILAETVWHCGPKKSLFNIAAALPVEEQQRYIADHEPVPVAVKEGDAVTYVMRPITALDSKQHKQVFGWCKTDHGKRRIIPADEQVAKLRAEVPRSRGVPIAKHVETADYKITPRSDGTGVIRFKRPGTMLISELVAALRKAGVSLSD